MEYSPSLMSDASDHSSNVSEGGSLDGQSAGQNASAASAGRSVSVASRSFSVANMRSPNWLAGAWDHDGATRRLRHSFTISQPMNPLERELFFEAAHRVSAPPEAAVCCCPAECGKAAQTPAGASVGSMRIHEFEAEAMSLIRWGCDSICQPGFPAPESSERLRMLGRRRAPRSDSSSNADCEEHKGGGEDCSSNNNADSKEQKGQKAAILQSQVTGHRLLGVYGPRVAWQFQCEAMEAGYAAYISRFFRLRALLWCAALALALLFVFVDVRQSTRPGGLLRRRGLRGDKLRGGYGGHAAAGWCV
eukprot:GHVU01038595.1.p1 GENE.GHVU01038595.1~~GHVU01038595.1.p1  ORF type:complete len:305 (+),score=39.41 GHVU01038595.1:694-1608(+)